MKNILKLVIILCLFSACDMPVSNREKVLMLAEKARILEEHHQIVNTYHFWITVICILALVFFVWLYYCQKMGIRRTREQIKKREKEMVAISSELREIQYQYLCTQQELESLRKHSDDHYSDLKKQRLEEELKLITVINKLGDICMERFHASDEYTQIKKKISKRNHLVNDEIDSFSKYVREEAFEGYIRELSIYLKLSAEDLLLCCLSLSGFSDNECAYCRSVDPITIRSRRCRIRKKISAIFENDALINKLFAKEA